MRGGLINFSIVLTLIVGTSFGLAWSAESAARQPDKVTGSGTKGNIARWVDTNEIGDSTITEDDGFFGVGTPINPNFKFLISSDLASPKATFRAGNIADGRAIEGSSVNGIGINGIGFISGVNGLNPTTNPNGAGIRGVPGRVPRVRHGNAPRAAGSGRRGERVHPPRRA